MKVLFLNPPGRRVYIRDYYCSKVTQADYISHPVDFLVQSAWLNHAGFDLHLVDAIADGLSAAATLERVRAIQPDGILVLAGAVSWGEDRAFFRELRMATRARLVATGDLFQEDVAGRMEECPALDAVLLDFTSQGLVRYLRGEAGAIPAMAIRREGMIATPAAPAEEGAAFELPCPPAHELFAAPRYRYPFARSPRYASVLTEFGCPFRCSFCIMAKLHHRRRSTASVLEELRHIRKLGRREIFFVDQTFGSNREAAAWLLEGMRAEGLGLSWFCFSRVDVVDEASLRLMREAGCHTIIFGIESGSDRMLAQYRKGYDKARIRSTLSQCRALGIRTVGTFILGLPEETEESAEETLAFLRELPLDYASFNVAVPRAGTDLRRDAVAMGLAEEGTVMMDQSGSKVAMPTKSMSREQVLRYRQRAVRQFYLRPAYWLRRLAGLRSAYDLVQNVRQGAALMRQTWVRKD